jgi:multicomponent K+:H+ antiporter subunit D
MNHLVVLPAVLPALTAAALLLLGRNRPAAARALSLATTAALLAVAAALLWQAAGGTQQVYVLGDWPAPFGIVLVADRLSTLLVALTSLVGFAALTYAVQGWDARGEHFHPLFQLQLMGLNGAFLTGDLFNLFVFFEVMLIASYCLLLHGLGAPRLRAAVHYVSINLAGSAVFLIAVSLLYSVTGTLNMAHLAERVSVLSAADLVLAHAAGLLLLGVFAVKGALFPLYFWLPGAYASASAPVAALFSIMTKVGVYAIVRVFTLVFGDGIETTADLVRPWILPAALATLGLAAIGALAAQRLSGLLSYLTVGSVGSMLIATALGSPAGLSAALYYLVHSTLAIAALFLLADVLARQRGAAADSLRPGPAIPQSTLLGIAFLVAAATVAGLPPFSGFIGKLMILQSAQRTSAVAWVWATVLGASFVSVLACARAGSLLMWTVSTQASAPRAAPARSAEWLPFVVLLACGTLLVAYAAPVQRYTAATAAQVVERDRYIAAVLGAARDRAPRPLPPGGRR